MSEFVDEPRTRTDFYQGSGIKPKSESNIAIYRRSKGKDYPVLLVDAASGNVEVRAVDGESLLALDATAKTLAIGGRDPLVEIEAARARHHHDTAQLEGDLSEVRVALDKVTNEVKAGIATLQETLDGLSRDLDGLTLAKRRLLNPAQLDTGTIGSGHIAEEAIEGRHLQRNAVGWRELAPNAVGGPHIKAGSIAPLHFAPASFTVGVRQVLFESGWLYHDSGRFDPRVEVDLLGLGVEGYFDGDSGGFYQRSDRCATVTLKLFRKDFRFTERGSISFSLPEQAPLVDEDDLYDLKTTAYIFDAAAHDGKGHDATTQLHTRKKGVDGGRISVSFKGAHHFSSSVEIHLVVQYATPRKKL